MAKKNLASLTKGGETTTKRKRGRPPKKKTTETTKKTTTQTKKEEPLSFDERVKEKVDGLVADFDLIPKDLRSKKEENEQTSEEKAVTTEEKKSMEWLSGELEKLVGENMELKKKIEQYEKQPNKASGNTGEVERKVIELFGELQLNHKRWGKNFIIDPPSFIQRMTKFFPFLEHYRID